MSRDSNNQGQHDGAKEREDQQNNPVGNLLSNLTGIEANYNPPSDKEEREDYKAGFDNAYHGK